MHSRKNINKRWWNSLKDLLKEYRTTRRETKTVLDNLKRKRDEIVKPGGVHVRLSCLTIQERETLILIDNDINTIRNWLSNLNFCITYLNRGHHPKARGIERRAAYEREIPFEPYWIQRRKDTTDVDYYESTANEDTDMVLISNESKEKLLESITQNLTDRQKEIIQLSSNGYSHEEIAQLLGVHKGTISRTISRVKEKIESEGWFIS